MPQLIRRFKKVRQWAPIGALTDKSALRSN